MHMEDRVNTAIIDATAEPDGESRACRAGARYVTPIANLPLIYHVFDELAASGIRRARIVADHSVQVELERVLEGGQAWEIDVSYVESQPGDGLPRLITEIEDALSSGPVLVHPGDSLFPHQVATMCDCLRTNAADLVLLGAEDESPRRDPHRGVGEPAGICETPLLFAPSSRRVLDELLVQRERAGDLVDSLLVSDLHIAVCDLAEHWFYSASSEALLAANRMLLDALPVPAVHGAFSGDNKVQGRVAISPGARVTRCSLHGPIVIDDGAVVEDSFVGPYTAISAGAIVIGAEIDNTMVLAGAEIQHPGARIEGSIIGERARVGRSFDLPRGLHLRLGPGSQVTLS